LARGPSHDAVNAVIAEAGRGLGFQYTPSEALIGIASLSATKQTLGDTIHERE
jgi:hypothetical protein